MLKRFVPFTLMILLLLSACTAPKENGGTDDTTQLSIVTTTYPLYLFACEVTKGVDDVTVAPLVNQKISCLHNYTLSVNDMKLLESADVILMNGAGLDAFLEDASLSNQNRSIVDCSDGIPLLNTTPPHHNDSDENEEKDAKEADPHFWMDPERAAIMVQNIAKKLIEIDPSNESLYRSNSEAAVSSLKEAKASMRERLAPLVCRELITFHDGFSYFADAFDLTILMSIEEEEGQEASAQVISETLSLIEAYGLPSIFTERNSSDATAQAISREASVNVYPLSLIMSGETKTPGIQLYLSAMEENVNTILEALQ
jgi:ABC-type Zn uptake system ZnuABC Zn-binding protein ZnuA